MPKSKDHLHGTHLCQEKSAAAHSTGRPYDPKLYVSMSLYVPVDSAVRFVNVDVVSECPEVMMSCFLDSAPNGFVKSSKMLMGSRIGVGFTSIRKHELSFMSFQGQEIPFNIQPRNIASKVTQALLGEAAAKVGQGGQPQKVA